MKKLLSYPTPVAGLALGLAGIGAFWSGVSPRADYALMAAILAALILIPLLLKFIVYPQQLLGDLKHPTVGSVVPTMAMALMLVGHAAGQFNVVAGMLLWAVACVAHAGFMLMFFYHRFCDRDLNHLVPSWYVPPIGIVVASLTLPSSSVHGVAAAIVYFGLLSYAVMLPIVLYRLIMGDRVEAARQPTLAILAAPPSLVLAGYLSVVPNPNVVLVAALFTIALLMTTVVYLLLVKLLQLPFTPAYSAFTFPLVIGATATHKVACYVAVHWGQGCCHWISSLSTIEAVLASMMVAYVACRYLAAFVAPSWRIKY